jgi:hypothetical protein
MRVVIEERDAKGGTTLYEPAVFCEYHGAREAERMGVRMPASWECCSSSWDHAHRVKTIVTVRKDDVTSKCQVCDAAELDEVFQRTLQMLESI